MPRFALRTGILFCFLLALVFLTFKTFQSQSRLQAAPKTAMIRAPEFPADAAWLNTDKPLSLRGLKGKIVLLDFWTYCCINCIHILPDLKKLERKYPNELVIIGVHSAKFENEGETQNIRNAILRYKIEHPVLNDKTMRVWDEYTVRGWPTLVLIDPNGRIVNQLSGEGHYAELDRHIGALVQEFKARGELKSGPMNFALEAAKVENTALRFPGKVLASNNKLFVADSNHNRVVVSDFNGKVETVFGSGAQGFANGDATQASFHNPQGMALSADQSTVFVADTDNHAIRALDLKTKKVTTLAGTGKQAEYRKWGGVGTKAALASPWDVLRVESTLYIAMAGTHQIWAMDLKTRGIKPYAGTGAEARYDARLQEAALAQPSGLATDGKVLFFADSESSAIRAATLPGQGDAVSTLAGGDPNPRNLFAFGDKDGQGFDAKLQHPLGVAFADGKVFVADTYNHKLKVLDPAKSAVSSLNLGEDWNEPAGVSVADGKLFVADTNNHAIRVVDLKTKRVSTLQFKNLPAPRAAEEKSAPEKDDEVLTLPTATLAPGGNGEIVFDVKMPAGFHLNTQAPQKWNARVEGVGIALAKSGAQNFKLPLRAKYTASNSGRGALVISSTIYYCTDDMRICKVAPVKIRAPFQIQSGGATAWRIGAQINANDSVSTR